MTWLFQNTPVEELPEDCIGFVYLITNHISGRKYIGKKLAKFSKTTVKTVKLKNGTKKKKRSAQKSTQTGVNIMARTLNSIKTFKHMAPTTLPEKYFSIVNQKQNVVTSKLASNSADGY